MNKFRFMIRAAKNARILHLVNTWRQNAIFVRRRRELGRKIFLSCEKFIKEYSRSNLFCFGFVLVRLINLNYDQYIVFIIPF